LIAQTALYIQKQRVCHAVNNKIIKTVSVDIDITKEAALLETYIDQVGGYVGFLYKGKIVGELFEHESYKNNVTFLQTILKTEGIKVSYLPQNKSL